MTNREIKQQFIDQNIHTILDKVRFWFFIRKLYWQKRIVIWEGLLDKLYFETKFPDDIRYNDAEDRKALQDQNRQPFEKQDQVMISSLEDRISRGKALRESYRRNEAFLADNVKYKEMLDIWFSDNETQA